jgi:Flp pilus assembly protein TadG
MKTAPMSWFKPRMPRSVIEMLRDCRGIAATEFAVIVPVMLVMFFGTVEFSSGVAVDRKITIFARAVSDITSQAPASIPQYALVTDTYLQNAFTSGLKILQPYLQNSSNSAKATVSEIYVDSTGAATIRWSRAAVLSPAATQAALATSVRNPNDVVTNIVPPALLVKKTYLIFSEVSYLYTPAVGYVMAKAGVTLSDFAYSRPRQATCLVYNNLPEPNGCPLK